MMLITSYSVLWLEIWLALDRKIHLSVRSLVLWYKETSNYHLVPTLPSSIRIWQLLQMKPDNEAWFGLFKPS